MAGDEYRVKAAELHARSKQETDPFLRAELEHLAHGYLRLAEQADRNAQNDVTYEPPLEQQPSTQQQQQSQPKPDSEE
jgi:hypothetical protein